MADGRLGAESDAQAGCFEHRQIVRAVPHGDYLLEPVPSFTRDLVQKSALRLPSTMGLSHLAGDDSIVARQYVRVEVVDADRCCRHSPMNVKPPEMMAVL